MKKLYIILLITVINGWSVTAQSPSWAWVKSAGGADSDYGQRITADVNGNVLVAGYFVSQSITFGSTVLNNAGPVQSTDIFIVKYDGGGNVLWAKSAGGNNFDVAFGISTDANGDVLVTGYFQSDTIIFGTDTLLNAGNRDVFVAKYDASGNVLWARSAGGTDYDEANGIAADANGNVLVTGHFNSGTISFGTTTLINTTLAGFADVFIVKYDASGNVVWANSAGGTSEEGGAAIAADGSGNVLVTGSFASNSIAFGQDTLLNAGSSIPTDIFVVKYDASGNVMWAKSAGKPAFSDRGYDIATDATGNAFVSGTFESDSITFGSAVLSNTGPGYPDLFIAKYDVSGNILWAGSAGGTASEFGAAVSTDGDGNVSVAGSFDSPSITVGADTLINAGLFDMLMLSYNAAGNFRWAKSAGGPGFDFGFGVATDPDRKISVTGIFSSTSVIFGTDTLINTDTTGTSDLFVAKLDSTFTIGIAESNPLNPVTVFPNPSDGKIRIASSENIDEIKITNLTGQIIYHTKPNEKNISLQLDEAGMYFVQVTMKDQMVTRKIIVGR